MFPFLWVEHKNKFKYDLTLNGIGVDLGTFRDTLTHEFTIETLDPSSLRGH